MNYSVTAIVIIGAFTLSFSAEKLFCGFEPAELAAWPSLTVLDTNGNDIGYSGPASVGFLISQDTLEATQGGYVFKNQIYPGAVPADFLSVRRYASRFQDWSQLISDWNPLRVPRGEYYGEADWLNSRFTNIFAMYKVLKSMDSLNNWSGYKWLCVDVKTSEVSATLRVQVEDKEQLSHYRHYQVNPGGWQTLCFPLADVAWVQGLDLSCIVNVRIILCNTAGPTTLLMDNIRLSDADTVSSPHALLVDNSPLFPWRVGSGWWGKSPLTATPPPVYVPQTRVTGPMTSSFSGRISTGRSGYGSTASYEDPYNIIPLDNNRLMVARPMIVRAYDTDPSYPNCSTPRAAMCTVDGGLTWTNLQGQGGAWPTILDNYCKAESATPQWIMGDNLLRGNGYVLEMGWCSARSDGAGVPLFWHFFKIALTGEQTWQVFPPTPPPAGEPQKPQRIISGCMPRTCDVRGPRLIALPNGQLWSCSNTLHPYYSFVYEVSYSVDGGIHWQHVGGRPYICNTSGPVNFLGTSNLVPFAGKAGVVISQDGALKMFLSNGSQWEPVVNVGNLGWSRLFECLSYRDSTLFFLIDDYSAPPRSLYLASYQKGQYARESTPIVSGVCNPRISLCGQTLWVLWTDSTDNSIKYRVYDIPSKTWLTSAQTIVQETAFPILYFHVPIVAPPAYMPVAWILNGPLPSGIAREIDYFNSPSFPANPDPFALKTAHVPIPPEQAVLDADYDGLEDSEEALAGTNPGNPDSDGDHLLDGQEVVLLGTNPLDKDTDHDGDDDDVELYYYTPPSDATKRASVNQNPAAALTADITSGPAPLTVHFDATGSVDPESNDAVQYQWDLGHVGPYWDYGILKSESLDMDGGNRMVYTFRQEGVYPVKLTVTDGRGGVDEQTVTITVTNGSGIEAGPVKQFAFFKNTFSPFSHMTSFTYTLPEAGEVCLKIYDLNGRLVKTLVKGNENRGEHRAVWRPQGSAPGVYLAKFMAGKYRATTKLILLK